MTTKSIYLSILLSSFSLILIAQSLDSDFDTLENRNQWTQYRLGDENEFYEWEFDQANSNSEPYNLVHYYPVGGSEAVMTGWFHHHLTFQLGGVIDPFSYAFSGFGTPMAGDTLAIYILEGSPDPSLATSQTIVYNFTDSLYLNDGVWRTESVVLPVFSDDSYVAFRYVTVVNWLDMRLDDVNIIQNTMLSVNENSDIQGFTVYPNPAKDLLTISGEMSKIPWLITDSTGRIILKGTENQIDISSFPAGTYCVKNGENTRKFLKL